ncbi:MAG: DUF305 domain-containing protein [Hyphomicrobiaceae bacterium]|nr:DUF305 domain-containing protein [Hyphomicrobiaceae bacterium]
MALLSFAAMYGLMYAMVNIWDNVFNNLNQSYMAGLMTAPMVLIELAVMRSMYQVRGLNIIVATIAVVALIAFFFLIRQQIAIGDRQFLRSMIPHHAGAILMCQKARLESPDIRSLCNSIVSSQESEIRQMKKLLEK